MSQAVLALTRFMSCVWILLFKGRIDTSPRGPLLFCKLNLPRHRVLRRQSTTKVSIARFKNDSQQANLVESRT
jgi:hypothetical protein